MSDDVSRTSIDGSISRLTLIGGLGTNDVPSLIISIVVFGAPRGGSYFQGGHPDFATTRASKDWSAKGVRT